MPGRVNLPSRATTGGKQKGMASIDVCFSPELLHLYDLKGKAVVAVDILRATSTMVTAFAHGVANIFPVMDLEECRGYAAQGCLTADRKSVV